jgi:hypothetical protein
MVTIHPTKVHVKNATEHHAAPKPHTGQADIRKLTEKSRALAENDVSGKFQIMARNVRTHSPLVNGLNRLFRKYFPPFF